jgi:hypothetical protein
MDNPTTYQNRDFFLKKHWSSHELDSHQELVWMF